MLKEIYNWLKMKHQLVFIAFVLNLSGAKYPFKYIGCYKDTEQPTALTVEYPGLYTSTVELCVSYCGSHGYSYAGMQFGNECRCGNDGYDLYGEGTGCYRNCSGGGHWKCGGSYQNSVYRIGRKKWTYVGCFPSISDSSISNQFTFISTAPTVDWCVTHCAKSGYRYAALQNQNECKCSNSEYAETDSRDHCYYLCSGNQRQKCGGWQRSSVYEIMWYLENYKGCYRDQPRRALAYEEILSSSLTVEYCISHCITKGYKYAALQDGNECRCGNSGYGRYGEEDISECNYLCYGNHSQFCGGRYHNDVYEIEILNQPAPTTMLPTIQKVKANTSRKVTNLSTVPNKQNSQSNSRRNLKETTPNTTTFGSNGSTSSSSIYLYIGMGVGGLLILSAIAAVLAFFFQKRKREENIERRQNTNNIMLQPQETSSTYDYESEEPATHETETSVEVNMEVEPDYMNSRASESNALYMNCPSDAIDSDPSCNSLSRAVAGNENLYSLAEPIENDLVVAENELYGT